MAVKYIAYRRNLPWVVTWSNSWTGLRHSRGFATEAEAEAFEQARKDLAAQEKAILKKSRKRKHSEHRITVRELLASYFALSESSPTTLKQAKYHAAHIIGAFGGRLACQLSPQDMLAFVEAQRLRGVAQSTANRRLSILRAALNWAVRSGLLTANPVADLRLPHAAARRIAPPTAREANAILAHAAPHVQRVVILGLYVGARIGPSELFRLTWNDVDMALSMIRMPSAEKNRREDGRDIPIRQALAPILQKWMEQDAERGVTHVIHWQGNPVRCISRAWHQALQRAGIHRRIRPYDLRHAYATYSLAGGADIKTVAELMGHTDASMILKTYQHVQDVQKRAAVEALPDILNLGGPKGPAGGISSCRVLSDGP